MRGPVRQAMEVCPVEVAIAVLGGSWKLTIVKHLQEGTLRSAELGRRLPACPPRTLTRQLRELEEDGIVQRTVYPEVPPRVEYALTDLGRTLGAVVTSINAWGKDYAAQV